MTDPIEFQVLRYLRFQTAASGHSGFQRASEGQWEQALAFADTAGLTLSLLDRLKQRGAFNKLPLSIQQGFARRLQDNLARTNIISRELIEFNRMLQSGNVRYLNLKGQVLCPDFVEQRE